MKIFVPLLILLTALNLNAQERGLSKYAFGVNYLKSEQIGADLKMYNLHFEKITLGHITFGGEIYFKTGTNRKQISEFEHREIKSFYFGGPTILYTNYIIGMLQYKISAGLNAGFLSNEHRDFDLVSIEESLYYGFTGKIEGMAIVSTKMQFNIGFGFMKGFTQGSELELDTNPFYHIGLTYLF